LSAVEGNKNKENMSKATILIFRIIALLRFGAGSKLGPKYRAQAVLRDELMEAINGDGHNEHVKMVFQKLARNEFPTIAEMEKFPQSLDMAEVKAIAKRKLMLKK